MNRRTLCETSRARITMTSHDQVLFTAWRRTQPLMNTSMGWKILNQIIHLNSSTGISRGISTEFQITHTIQHSALWQSTESNKLLHVFAASYESVGPIAYQMTQFVTAANSPASKTSFSPDDYAGMGMSSDAQTLSWFTKQSPQSHPHTSENGEAVNRKRGPPNLRPLLLESGLAGAGEIRSFQPSDVERDN